MKSSISVARDALLFTPGPLTTSLTTKQAMLRDHGSWHGEFIDIVSHIRRKLLALANLSAADGWEVVLMQGSGTFGVESVFQSCVPRQGKVMVLSNGAYGDRMIQMLKHAGIDHGGLRYPESEPISEHELDHHLQNDPSITHVAVVHCETTTGMLNPISRIGEVVKRHGKIYIVDAMSSFGGMPIDFWRCGIDYLVASANKCIEGVPGVAFVICRRADLLACAGFARSLSLDLAAQFAGFEKDGKFRFTPPTHVLAALHQALIELESEGGIEGRNRRYRRNHETLQDGMRRLGFEAFLESEQQSPIITAYHYPVQYEFDFKSFYERLAARGFVIYPGKLTETDTFRIGNIGRIFEADILALLSAIRDVLVEDGINLFPITESLHVNTN